MRAPTATKLICTIALLLATSCQSPESPSVDLAQIAESGTLKAIISYSATSYFLYRGQPMGFDYELLQRFAEKQKLDLEIVIARDLDEMMGMLQRGEGDLVAHGLTITKERKEQAAFTQFMHKTRQVLVQRKPENWRDMKLHEIENELIRDPHDLIGRQVHVRRMSSYYQRLLHLSEEIGGDIDVQTVSGDLTTEELIGQVAESALEFTVADHNIAAINATYYDNIDIETRIGAPQRIAWAVRQTSPLLLQALDDWLAEMMEGSDYYAIYNRYYAKRRSFARHLRSSQAAIEEGRISQYDDIIKTHAAKLDWDWRLLASMIYQESRFDPEANSWAGASGLMQLMPAMARKFGADSLSDPEQSIAAGTAYLAYLQNLWRAIPGEDNRRTFVLASYNVGENHIADARRLAKTLGRNLDLWDDNVEDCVLLLSDPEYFQRDEVRYGFCRGKEPYNYVRQILDRYEHYNNVANHVGMEE
ncbi:MAG: transporter substrate-binding domain-containing protein [bacterium]|nr:transporter substrate-binding domain-containing protein [bacterium]